MFDHNEFEAAIGDPGVTDKTIKDLFYSIRGLIKNKKVIKLFEEHRPSLFDS